MSDISEAKALLNKINDELQKLSRDVSSLSRATELLNLQLPQPQFIYKEHPKESQPIKSLPRALAAISSMREEYDQSMANLRFAKAVLTEIRTGEMLSDEWRMDYREFALRQEHESKKR